MITQEERNNIHKLLDQMLDEGRDCMVLQWAKMDMEHVTFKRCRLYLKTEEDKYDVKIR